MCSIAMPAKLLLGHSPPVYSSLLYNPLVVTTPITNRSVPPRIRPCLSSGSLNLDTLRNNNGNGKQKKRVVFADDRGRPLTQVRVMSEPSNVPPLWSTAYVAGLTGGLLRASKEDQDTTQDATSSWQVTFPQPASDYLTFRHKIDQDNVSLENVIVRESEQCLVGTVKVRNLAYDKEVIVRASSDCWSTHEDVHCTYVEQLGASAFILYDTFRFRLTLPVASNVIEFCVQYRTNGMESWDNNDGNNYLVRKKQEPRLSVKRLDNLSTTCNGQLLSKNEIKDGVPRIADATRVNMRTWSEFASWHHLTNDAPYW